MLKRSRWNVRARNGCRRAVMMGTAVGFLAASAGAAVITLEVKDGAGNPVNGFRWLVEVDNTLQPEPGVPVSDSIAVNIHKSHAPVVASGHTDTGVALIDVPDGRDYMISALPDGGHTLSGTRVAAGQLTAVVIVNPQPVPTAQISVLAFHDNAPINNAPEVPVEEGLRGFSVILHDAAGQVMFNAFGHPLGTTYQLDPLTGQVLTDPVTGEPIVDVPGSGVIKTGFTGEALVKYLVPGKYGVQVVPPDEGWIQTSTLEGTPTIDAWVKANEPPRFVEFGPSRWHVFVGFVRAFDLLATQGPPGAPTGSVTGRVVYNHFSRPPNLADPMFGFFGGKPVESVWVGLNNVLTRRGVFAGPATDPDGGTFAISGIPAGTYGLVTWDVNLDSIFGFNTVTIPDANGNWDIDLGDVLAFPWFGTLEGSVFYDQDQDGFRDQLSQGDTHDEPGMPFQDVLLRFRDGTIYQATFTDLLGDYAFSEVFPFFKWLVVEVGFRHFKDTGLTAVVDDGGEVLPHNGWVWPSFDALRPQPQFEADGVTPRINPNTGNNLSRSESAGRPGDFLLQVMHLFLGQTNRMDFGKKNYARGENGGISGIVYYAVTRAEDDPRLAAAEAWEPGIPRVQMNLYRDRAGDGEIDDLDGDGGPTLADVDNHPLGWFDDPLNPAAKGPEDVDRNGNGRFDPGDAIQITHTDSFDDNRPSGCIQNIPVVHGSPVPECMDNFGTWNQIRPGVFDGGFLFGSYFAGGMANNAVETDTLPPGLYIVEAATPPGYEIVKEEDKNVDYGDTFVAAGLFDQPAGCVGDPHTVPDVLSLFGGIAAPFATEVRPLCDRKLVAHANTQNTAVEFFLFTPVPKAARAVGFINNDLAAEFDTTSPISGEKQAPKWVPISFQDFAGNEIVRTYSDEWGGYNALLPSSFTTNVASPTGVSENMLQFIINHPGPIEDPDHPGEMIIDPFFDPTFSQTPYTFNFGSGKTTYLDTPVIPVAAFAGSHVACEAPDHTPVIKSVVGPGASSGPVVCIGPRVVQAITIRSSGGKVRLRNPDPAGPPFIYRYYGFGDTPGQVTLDGVPLAVTDWTDRRITVMLIANTPKTGHIMVQRGDNGRWTEMGVTLHVRDCTTNPVVFLRGGSVWPDTPIQDAIDAAAAGTLIVVGEGTYEENVIVYKNVQLQGAGAGGTFINGNPIPTERVDRWLAKIRALIAGGDLVLVDPEGAQGFFEATEAPVVMVQGKPETFGPGAGALVDGFTLLGGVAGGGVFVPSFADYLQISCNRIMNNQGTFGGAITVGLPNFDIRGLGGVPVDALNEGVGIRHNKIIKNGGITGGGGVTLFAHSKNYAVADNIICGNFSRHVGGGIAHIGRSDGGTIARNRIVFNEVFFGGEVGGDGGGVYVGDDIVFPGLPANPPAAGALGDGAGNVTIDSNLIQGNLAGSASGGGLYARSVNGADVLGSRPFRTLVFQDAAGGYAGTADAAIDSTRPNTPLGTATTGVWGRNFLSGDQQWLLLRFDNLIGPGASQIPPGATIRSAQITLTVTDDGGAPPNVYRVLRPWDESTVTWNGFGGLPTAGVDYQTPAEMAAGAIGPIGPSPYEIPIFVTQSVQSWAHGAPNHGWILQPVGGLDVSVASRESPQAGFRPTLEVQYYTGPGNPDQWYSLTVTNNMIVNNVAAYQGGGVVLQNTAKARILHNTISHNDSTATSALAFPPGGLVQSVPQGAGLVSLPHDRLMAEATGQAFSDPLLGNTILWENRSFHWDSGVLVPDGTRDLAVVQGVGVMDPQSCVLTDTTGYAATNIDTDPNFEAAYENTLLTAGVFDEGGTFITVRFEELSVDSGNYHLAPASPVSNRASTALAGLLPELTLDIDGELRPQGLGPEIGADELSPVCGDGTIDAGEGCDDGNTIDGDGCSSACQVESRFGDVDGDGDVDRCDLILILSARGRPADGPDDPRDLDGDGFITALDARMLIPLCDVPRCGRCLP